MICCSENLFPIPEKAVRCSNSIAKGIFHQRYFNVDNKYCMIGSVDMDENMYCRLSKNQILLIKRLTKNITLLFDNDKAGISATIRSIDLCLQLDMNVKVCLFPSSFSSHNVTDVDSI